MATFPSIPTEATSNHLALLVFVAYSQLLLSLPPKSGANNVLYRIAARGRLKGNRVICSTLSLLRTNIPKNDKMGNVGWLQCRRNQCSAMSNARLHLATLPNSSASFDNEENPTKQSVRSDGNDEEEDEQVYVKANHDFVDAIRQLSEQDAGFAELYEIFKRTAKQLKKDEDKLVEKIRKRIDKKTEEERQQSLEDMGSGNPNQDTLKSLATNSFSPAVSESALPLRPSRRKKKKPAPVIVTPAMAAIAAAYDSVLVSDSTPIPGFSVLDSAEHVSVPKELVDDAPLKDEIPFDWEEHIGASARDSASQMFGPQTMRNQQEMMDRIEVALARLRSLRNVSNQFQGLKPFAEGKTQSGLCENCRGTGKQPCSYCQGVGFVRYNTSKVNTNFLERLRRAPSESRLPRSKAGALYFCPLCDSSAVQVCSVCHGQRIRVPPEGTILNDPDLYERFDLETTSVTATKVLRLKDPRGRKVKKDKVEDQVLPPRSPTPVAQGGRKRGRPGKAVADIREDDDESDLVPPTEEKLREFLGQTSKPKGNDGPSTDFINTTDFRVQRELKRQPPLPGEHKSSFRRSKS